MAHNPLGPLVTNWVTEKSPASAIWSWLRRSTSSLMSNISWGDKPGSIRAYFRDRYSRSMWSFIRKLLPLKVRATSKTTSPPLKPRSKGDIFTWLNGIHSPLKYAV